MNKFTKLVITIFLLAVIVTSLPSFGIAFNTIRLYLHPTQSPSTVLHIANSEGTTQNCTVNLQSSSITNEGNIKIESGSDSEISKFVRFAPKKFTLSPTQNQNIKFIYRRQTNTAMNEYQGLVRVRCVEQGASDDIDMVKIQAVIAHNIPLIVRTKNSPINIDILKTKIEENVLTVSLATVGDRSITGGVVISSEDSKALAKTNDFTIYPQVPSKELKIMLPDGYDLPLTITFKENESFGGKIQLQKIIN